MEFRKYLRMVESEALFRLWPTWHTLSARTTLYHGTNAEFDPDDDELMAPAWFSTSVSVAKHFARGGRIYRYQVINPISLPVIKTRADRARFFERFDLDDGGAEDIADSMKPSGLPGWIIPDNYPDGDDIMLVKLGNIQRIDVVPVSSL